MNTELPDPMPDDDRTPLPVSLRAALADLRRDVTPARELWPEIAARIADPEAREHLALPPALAAELKALRRDAPASPALWQTIATRIESSEARDHCALPASLAERLAALPRETAPARDLWPAVAARTVARTQQPWRRPMPRYAGLALAASLVVVVALLVQIERSPGGVPSQAGSSKAPLRPSAEAYVATIGAPRRADPELLRARYRPISPEARTLVQANLQIVDSAEAQIERAMADDPDSVAELQALLDSAREQRAQLRAALDARP
jgi:hypothetical protein